MRVTYTVKVNGIFYEKCHDYEALPELRELKNLLTKGEVTITRTTEGEGTTYHVGDTMGPLGGLLKMTALVDERVHCYDWQGNLFGQAWFDKGKYCSDFLFLLPDGRKIGKVCKPHEWDTLLRTFVTATDEEISTK